MSITFQNQADNYAYGGVSTQITLDVTAGDLIVVWVGAQWDHDTPVYCDEVTDDIGNTYTVRPVVKNGKCSSVFAYVLSSVDTDSENVITVAYNVTNDASKYVIGSCYEPDGGDTVTLEDSSGNSSAWQSSPWDTGANQITTTGTDELLIAGFVCVGSRTYSEQEIPSGVTTDVNVLTASSDADTCFYRIMTEGISNAEAEVTVTGGDSAFAAEILAFKAESSITDWTTHEHTTLVFS